MASVQSLGLHRPWGLRHAIEEQLLPPDAPLSSYTWDVFPDRGNGGNDRNGSEGIEEIEDELLVTDDCVLWCRGGIFRKTFKFDLEKEPVSRALLTYFPTSEDEKLKSSSSSSLQRALVVFLKTQAHIYMLSGTSHVVHMPFEVENACAAPVGVIIQTRQKAENVAPIALRFPRVPPNSFVSSQLSVSASAAFSSSQQQQQQQQQQAAFSVEGLGRPKPLHLNLGSTLENMWDAPLEQPESRWPRLVCLTDPLLDIGLVVTNASSDRQQTAAAVRPRSNKSSAKQHVSLDSAEEILFVEQIQLPGISPQTPHEPVILGVTINREMNSYTIWRLSYLEPEDPFIKRHKASSSSSAKSVRRRSSMQPGFASGTSTPVQPGHRDSFGTPLPGKRSSRKSERFEQQQQQQQPLDLVSTLEKQDREVSGVTRRSSRRLSSMLARADLSASYDRSVFPDHPPGSAGNISSSKRPDSLGGGISGIGGIRTSSIFNHQAHPSLGSLLEAPLDESFHSIKLDDHEFDGLQREILFTRLHTVPVDSSSFRYSISSRGPPAQRQAKVFVLTAPPFATDGAQNGQILIGIQEPVEKRLQLITLYPNVQPRADCPAKTGKTGKTDKRGASRHESKSLARVTILPGDSCRAPDVVDSCKIVDGDQAAILVLSESVDGRHELSTQAPWSELTKLLVPALFVDDAQDFDQQSRGGKAASQQLIDLTSGGIVGMCHARHRGIVDVVDAQGRPHQLRIQLRPTSPQVAKILDVCRGVLPGAFGERIHVGWLHVMQWLQDQGEAIEAVGNKEWSAISILLLAMFLALDRTDLSSSSSSSSSSPTKRQPVRRRKQPSSSYASIQDSDDWKLLEKGEAANALGCPVWMMNRGWQWALEEKDGIADGGAMASGAKFISRHIMLAKEYMASASGANALGPAGYLPTSIGRDPEKRRKVASDIFLALHLHLEEQKLDIMSPEYAISVSGRADFRVLLCQISRWLGWHRFSSVYEIGIQEDVDLDSDAEFRLKSPIPEPPTRPDVLEWIQSRLIGDAESQFLVPADIFYSRSRLPQSAKAFDGRWDSILPRTLIFKRFFNILSPQSTAVEIVEAMHTCGLTSHVLDTLPEAVKIPLQDAISMCQPHPPASWSDDLLGLVKRTDISLILDPDKRLRLATSNILTPTHTASWDFKMLCEGLDQTNNQGHHDEGEGTERQAVIRALFKEDRRLNEVQGLLSTHKARVVRIDQDPGLPESDYLEKQKEVVSRIATGTMAIPAGRGLLYYSLRFPLITQKLHIGGFNLNCIVRPSNVTVGVDKSLFTEEKVCWGFFHQGVAAGLAISPQAKGIDTSWILYNKPGQELSNRHAGFLLALGLNGHLRGVAKWVAFKYLTPKHTMTSIGLLLGLAASYMGTMDSLITRLLSVHATRMLPRGVAELNLSPLTQTSGIMGIGLLYCGSQHRRMSEIMLSEIEHIEDENEEEPLRNECYRLAAGFSLGFINLGKGADLKGLRDLRLTEKLITHATATKNVEIVHVLDRASAGAVMAVALIFMKTEDQIVARKIDVPNALMQFDYVRPDILLLRALTKNLILWSKIEPTFTWIHDNLPTPFRSRHRLEDTVLLQSVDLPFFSILAGICFSIALRYSGSASSKVRDLLLHYLDQFMRIVNLRPPFDESPSYDEELAKTNARMCQDVLAVSCAIVMAGTGDIPVLRRLRALHGRDDPDTPYGSHLAAHLAIGALFLGCGTATFGTSNKAIAAMLVAFYPIFPVNVMDNRAHLQAFRHFWVLAAEQRCLVAKDALTGQPISVPVHIRMLQQQQQQASSASSAADLLDEQVLYRTTPCLLPPLDHIASVSTACGPQFWDVKLDFSSPHVRDSFALRQDLYLRRRSPREGAFTSTLRALGEASENENQDVNANPLAWVLELDGLRGLSYAERAALLDPADEEQGGIGGSVDALLEMGHGITEGGDRERLEGARLLFEWGNVRDRMRPAGRGDADVSVDEEGLRHEMGAGDLDAEGDAEGAWWIRDSAIEALKGKVWLAAQEEQ